MAPLKAVAVAAGDGRWREGLDGADRADKAEEMSTRRTESVRRVDGKRSPTVHLTQNICDACEAMLMSRGEEAPCCDI